MAGPNMTKEKYDSLSRRQKVVYWAVLVVAISFVGYMLLF